MALPHALRVMVVDDSPYMRLLVATILAGFGVRHVVEAGDGADALDQLSTASQIDLIITDYVMSPLDGIEFIRMLRRERGHGHRQTPIVMMTGHAEPGTVKRARDAGVTEVLAKPLTARELNAKCRSALEAPRPFIDAAGYVGPCRRRKLELVARGRRTCDDVSAEAAGPEPSADPRIEQMIAELQRRRKPGNSEAVDKLLGKLSRLMAANRASYDLGSTGDRVT